MDLCENFCNRFPFVGKRKGTSRLGHNDLVLREAQRSSNGRVEIWNSHATLAHFAAFAVSGSMDIASSDATTCQQATESRISRWLIPVMQRRKTQEFEVDVGSSGIPTALANFDCVLRQGLL